MNIKNDIMDAYAQAFKKNRIDKEEKQAQINSLKAIISARYGIVHIDEHPCFAVAVDGTALLN